LSEPLHILHVDDERGFSGGEVQVFLLLEGLRERGHRNVLVCDPAGLAHAEACERGIETLPVRMRNYLDAAAVLRLRSAFSGSGADLVHLHTGRATWLGGLAARWAGLPALTTRRMDRRVKRGWRTRVIYESLVQRAVAISPAVAERLASAGVESEIIRSAVDPAALESGLGRERARADLGGRGDEPMLLCVARLHRRKGVDVLLHALPEVEARLWIAGDGPERAALESLAAELGVSERVCFLGTRDDTADLLAACDVFVLPSRLEGLGVATLEAMAASRPVVASDVGGIADAVVAGRTGLLVPPEDAHALADALRRVLGDAELRLMLGRAGPGRVAEGFLASQMVEAYEALYRALLASGNTRLQAASAASPLSR
jgi:glycosyltransferase involved in cell wall biosynthesis